LLNLDQIVDKWTEIIIYLTNDYRWFKSYKSGF